MYQTDIWGASVYHGGYMLYPMGYLSSRLPIGEIARHHTFINPFKFHANIDSSP
jgi:hypothetical protein